MSISSGWDGAVRIDLDPIEDLGTAGQIRDCRRSSVDNVHRSGLADYRSVAIGHRIGQRVGANRASVDRSRQRDLTRQIAGAAIARCRARITEDRTKLDRYRIRSIERKRRRCRVDYVDGPRYFGCRMLAGVAHVVVQQVTAWRCRVYVAGHNNGATEIAGAVIASRRARIDEG